MKNFNRSKNSYHKKKITQACEISLKKTEDPKNEEKLQRKERQPYHKIISLWCI